MDRTAPGLILLLAAPAWAGSGRAVPSLGDGPGVAAASRHTWDVRWVGEPGRVEARVDGRWTVVADAADGHASTRPLPGLPTFRVWHADGTATALETSPIWTPADVAAWSGPGLRGARVTGLAPASSGVWVSTDGGGAAFWNGSRWAHLDRRRVLPDEHALDISLRDGARHVRLTGSHVEIEPDGRVRVVAPHAPDTETPALHTDGRRDEWITPEATWTAGEDGVRRADTEGASPPFTPPGGLVRELTGLGTGVAGAADEAGLWLLAPLPDGTLQAREVRVLDGLPHPAVRRVVPRGRGRIWAGTDRGVALVNAAGTATPLPLAPLAAGRPVHAVLPAPRGDVLVAAEAGLVWLGSRPPKGFEAWAIAVGPDPAGVHDAKDAWWAWRGPTAWRLDRKGRLGRWDAAAPIVDLVAGADMVALATPLGLRWWVPGAKMLSPVDPIEGVAELDVGPDGGLWVRTGSSIERLPGGPGASWAVDDAHAVHAVGPGALVASDEGVRWLTLGRSETTTGWRDVDTGPVVDVTAAAGRTWVLGADGRVHHADARDVTTHDLSALSPDVQVFDLAADAHGAWVRTDVGLFYVRAR